MSDKLNPKKFSDFARECFGHQVKAEVIQKKSKSDIESRNFKDKYIQAAGVAVLCTGLLMFSFNNRSPSGIALRMKMMKENPLYKTKIETVVGTMLVTTLGFLYYCDQTLFADNPYSVGLIGRK